MLERYHKTELYTNQIPDQPFGTLFEPVGSVRSFCLAVCLLAACRAQREDPVQIAPARPRPAPTATAAIRNLPTISTAGSPAPVEALAPGTQLVTVHRTGISMRQMVPRGHTAFHIRNQTPVPHEIRVRGANGVAGKAAVSPGGRTILQMPVTEPSYELVCITPGHRGRAEFSTYAAGSPPDARRAGPPRP